MKALSNSKILSSDFRDKMSRDSKDRTAKHHGKNFRSKLADSFSGIEITLKMADQRWSDIYVVLPRSFAVVTFVFGKLQSQNSQDSFKWVH